MYDIQTLSLYASALSILLMATILFFFSKQKHTPRWFLIVLVSGILVSTSNLVVSIYFPDNPTPTDLSDSNWRTISSHGHGYSFSLPLEPSVTSDVLAPSEGIQIPREVYFARTDSYLFQLSSYIPSYEALEYFDPDNLLEGNIILLDSVLQWKKLTQSDNALILDFILRRKDGAQVQGRIISTPSILFQLISINVTEMDHKRFLDSLNFSTT